MQNLQIREAAKRGRYRTRQPVVLERQLRHAAVRVRGHTVPLTERCAAVPVRVVGPVGAVRGVVELDEHVPVARGPRRRARRPRRPRAVTHRVPRTNLYLVRRPVYEARDGGRRRGALHVVRKLRPAPAGRPVTQVVVVERRAVVRRHHPAHTQLTVARRQHRRRRRRRRRSRRNRGAARARRPRAVSDRVPRTNLNLVRRPVRQARDRRCRRRALHRVGKLSPAPAGRPVTHVVVVERRAVVRRRRPTHTQLTVARRQHRRRRRRRRRSRRNRGAARARRPRAVPDRVPGTNLNLVRRPVGEARDGGRRRRALHHVGKLGPAAAGRPVTQVVVVDRRAVVRRRRPTHTQLTVARRQHRRRRRRRRRGRRNRGAARARRPRAVPDRVPGTNLNLVRRPVRQAGDRRTRRGALHIVRQLRPAPAGRPMTHVVVVDRRAVVRWRHPTHTQLTVARRQHRCRRRRRRRGRRNRGAARARRPRAVPDRVPRTNLNLVRRPVGEARDGGRRRRALQHVGELGPAAAGRPITHVVVVDRRPVVGRRRPAHPQLTVARRQRRRRRGGRRARRRRRSGWRRGRGRVVAAGRHADTHRRARGRARDADHRAGPQPAARAARRAHPGRGRFRRRGEVRLHDRRRRRLPLKRRVHRQLHRTARHRVHRHRRPPQRVRRQRHLLKPRVQRGRAPLTQQEQHRRPRHRQVVAVANLHQGRHRRPLLDDVDAVLTREHHDAQTGVLGRRRGRRPRRQQGASHERDGSHVPDSCHGRPPFHHRRAPGLDRRRASRCRNCMGDAACLYLVLEGIVQLESDGAEPLVAGPGATLVVAETLAGSAAGRRASVVRACRVLKAERDGVQGVVQPDGPAAGPLSAACSRAAGPPRRHESTRGQAPPTAARRRRRDPTGRSQRAHPHQRQPVTRP